LVALNTSSGSKSEYKEKKVWERLGIECGPWPGVERNGKKSYLQYEVIEFLRTVTMLKYLHLGAIQIIRDTFLAYFRPPLPHVSFDDIGSDPPLRSNYS